MVEENINLEDTLTNAKEETIAQDEHIDFIKSHDDFVNQVIEIRKEKNLSQKQASRNSKVSQSTISRLEAGQLDPGLKVIIKYLNSLNKAIKIIDI